MMSFLLRLVITAAGLWIATQAVAGVHVRSTTTLLVAALVLGLVNAIVRPILFVLTLPVTILTLGLFLFVLNAAMVGLAAWFVPGFHVASFRAALLTAIIVWIVSWLGHLLVRKPRI
ncbi:MAG TPA: phage holin family protein [Steroidobacteraceae bacterium]|nr:phage holin family protein [Steroidobacteraceae bacterium]